MFSLTTTAGGDTGAHHYPAQYLIQELLPNFRLTGWAPGWYAGMPMLTFYFPFPFLLIAILDWFLPYQIAFKFITVLGVFALPLCAYAMGRLFRIRKPFPALAAVLSLGMLLMESYSIYGGNILSTLAGEFGYMLSFALVPLFLGTLYRGMERPRFNMLFVLNCFILMMLALSHIVTTMVLVFVVPGLLLMLNAEWRSWRPFLVLTVPVVVVVAALRAAGVVPWAAFALIPAWTLLVNLRPRLRTTGYLVAVGVIGFCLTAFWSLPFAANLEWTAHMAWNQLASGWDLFPMDIRAQAVLALVGMAYAVANKDRKTMLLGWMTAVTFALFWLLPNGRLWNARVLPFWFMSLNLWAAYAVAWLARPFVVIVWDLFRAGSRVAKAVYVPVFALIVALLVAFLSNTAGGWIEWNYKGYENKPEWTTYKEINDYIDSLDPPGRVLVEHGNKLDQFGTPRAFEIIPYWTRQDTMEGTLMEASFTAAFHFINQAELSEQPSNAIIGVKYPPLDISRGITHLQLMNIPYFLCFYNEDREEQVVTGLLEDPRADLLASWGDYNLFRISGCSGYVEVMKNQPVRLDVEQKDWRDLIVEWYKTDDALDTPIVWDNGEEALQQFASITPDEVTAPPEVPVATDGYVTGEMLQNERLEFDTTAIGQPHWIKISYFPNWHVEGAIGPFLAAPSFMMVIPTQSHVVLEYGGTKANWVGQGLEVAAWALLIALSIWRLVIWRRQRGEEAVPAGYPGSVDGDMDERPGPSGDEPEDDDPEEGDSGDDDEERPGT